MNFIHQKQIKEAFLKHLSPLEHLMAIGVFTKVPPTAKLLLTRGLAWLFSDRFYVAVTNYRLLLLPDPKAGRMGDVIQADFDEVRFFDGLFQYSILEIQKKTWKESLQLCFKPRYDILGSNKYDFIGAVIGGKAASIAAQP